jgi:hypothetical protein
VRPRRGSQMWDREVDGGLRPAGLRKSWSNATRSLAVHPASPHILFFSQYPGWDKVSLKSQRKQLLRDWPSMYSPGASSG